MLSAEVIKGFTERYLLSHYDDPTPIPEFHMRMWDLCGSDEPNVAIAAPRGFAKSSSITLAFTLASVLFREDAYVVLLSDTEGQAQEFLGDIRMELQENERLKQDFKISKILKDTELDLIVMLVGGYFFRIIAKGSEQKLRGRKWRHMRPSLFICDDIENEDIVMTDDRRVKFRHKFFRSVKQAGRDGARYRVVGTILHEDSLLNRLMKNRAWKSMLLKAHKSFDDFSELLWPGRKTEEMLRTKRQEFIDEGDSEGYSQEFLNDPFDHNDPFFRADDMLDISEDAARMRVTPYCAADLAISERKTAAFTAIGYAGLDSDRRLQVRDVRRMRIDSPDIIDEIFSIAQRAGLDKDGEFYLESENIAKTIGPFIEEEMRRRNFYFTIIPVIPSKDKRKRATPLRAMMRAGKVLFNKGADWYPDLENEIVRFPKSTYKDQVDMLSMIAANINRTSDPATDQEIEDEDYEEEFGMTGEGMCQTTGY